jgi:predicted N-formylglutamate amidohydrolase
MGRCSLVAPDSRRVPRIAHIDRLLLTCEHGGNRIPPRYRGLFQHAEPELRSHRGYDIGALTLARRLQRTLHAPLIASVTSRLLVDLNRSLHHPDLFSDRTRQLNDTERAKIIDRFYRPHRERVEVTIAHWIRQRRTVLHLSIHSFTPRLRGVTRHADVGLLYDPGRAVEHILCQQWRSTLREISGLRVRRNYPYRGNADGLTTYLRQRFPSGYLGLELEVSNRLLDARRAQQTGQIISTSLRHLLRTTTHRDHRIVS